MTRTTLLSHSTAVALGVAVTLAAGGVEFANAMDYEMDKIVEMKLGAGAAATFEGFIEAQFCPKVDVEFGLEADTCDIALMKSRTNGIREVWRDLDGDGEDEWVVAAQLKGMAGSWTPQAPQ